MTAVLFVRLSALGDVVQGIGAVQALHRVRPDWRLTFATQTTFAPLLAGEPGIGRVVGFERRGGLRAALRLANELRRERYDVAIDLQGNWKSASVARLSGARERWGAGASWRQEAKSRCLLTRTIDVPGARHPALVAWTLVRALAPETPFLPPVLRASPEQCDAEAEALRGAGIDPERPFRVCVITDPRDVRALRPAVVAAEVAASDRPVVQLLGPAEAGLEVGRGTRVLRHGRGELPRLVALGQVVARAGGDVIGPDQGATHVLAAAGARCTVLFGAQDPAQTAPPAAAAIVHPDPPACSPCRRRRCDHPRGPVCMAFPWSAGRPATNGLPPFAR